VSIRTIIVDDEPLAREGIRLRLVNVPGITVIGEYSSARTAAAAIERDRPDLMFLDVEMPEEDGISLLRRTNANIVPAVILVTAHEEHAIDAFEVNVVDYVLKPIAESRFRLALERARQRLEERRAVRLGERLRELVADLDAPTTQQRATPATRRSRPASFLTRFLVRVGNRERPVSVASVDWIEAAGDYARLHCGVASYLVRETMTALERVLDPRVFGRIHRSAIVRFDRVASLVAMGHGDCEVRLTTGAVLRLSRSYRDRFRAALSRSGAVRPRPSPAQP
jgi:two-component system LytT family response regulator